MLPELLNEEIQMYTHVSVQEVVPIDGKCAGYCIAAIFPESIVCTAEPLAETFTPKPSSAVAKFAQRGDPGQYLYGPEYTHVN